MRRFAEPINRLREVSRRAAHGEDAIVTTRPPKPRVAAPRTVRPQSVTPHPTIVTAREIAKQRVNANVSDPNRWNPRFQQGTRPTSTTAAGQYKPWKPKL